MSAEGFVHWVAAGDPQSARRHRLTLLAACGATYVPHRRGIKSPLPSCPKCEEENGPIDRTPPKVVDDLPHYVYRCFDADGELLYVGCTADPKARGAQHRQDSWWFPQVASSRVTIYPSKLHARRVERDAIASEHPIWNVRHQDFAAWDRERIEFVHELARKREAPDSVMRRFKRLSRAS